MLSELNRHFFVKQETLSPNPFMSCNSFFIHILPYCHHKIKDDQVDVRETFGQEGNVCEPVTIS